MRIINNVVTRRTKLKPKYFIFQTQIDLYKAEANDEIDNNKGYIDERQHIVNDGTKNVSSESRSSSVILSSISSNGLHEFLCQHSLVLKENYNVEENDEKGKDEAEEKPDIDILDDGGCWQAAGH